MVGIAMAVTRMIGAATDPVVGMVSDNTRTRWGRRRPYIVIATLLGAIMLPLLWMVPGHTPLVQYSYVIAMVALFSIIYSFFSVPYGALGLELTNDYDDRTRVFAWRGYIQMSAVFTGSWFYWFCLRPVFKNEIIGVRWLSVIAGVIMVSCAMAMVRSLRERKQRTQPAATQPKEHIPLGIAIKQTFKNRPFILIQAATLVVFLGTGVDGPIGMYLHVYYACQGNKEYASLISGAGGTLATISIFLAPPLAMWLSTRMGKREAALGGMLIMLLGVLIIPITLSPAHPYWVIATWVLSTIGSQCSALMASSMMADICDEDELVTGLRREGTYFATAGFLAKSCQMLVLLIGGWIPHLAGYTNFAVAPSTHQLERMKLILIGTQMTGLLIAIALIWCYPITRARAMATRRLLDDRKSA
jgi:GPH family glycoside/pentoside/hexuronide:cation symporter